MRTKLLALAILIIFLWIPFFFYTSYISGSEAKLTIVGQGDYFVNLEGTFGYSFLPLADKFLEIQKNCSDICIITPIPKADHKVVISQTGSIDFETTLLIPKWSEVSLEYLPKNALKASQSFVKPKLPESDGVYNYLAYIKNDTFLVENISQPRSIGFLVGNVYRQVREMETSIVITTDVSENFIILTREGVATIISKDFSEEVELPAGLSEIVSIAKEGNTWKVQTPTTVYESVWNEWRENIRFSDFLDISRTKRIGYIRGEDTKKLSLGNFPLGQGVLILLDRSTGESYTLETGVKIQSLIMTENWPAMMDEDGTITLLKIE